MNNENRALRRAVLLIKEGVEALSEVARKQKLRESLETVTRSDGKPLTPTDLYNCAREMTPSYGGEVGSNLQRSAQYLYAASDAFIQQQNAKQAPAQNAQQAPAQQAPAQAQRPAAAPVQQAAESRRRYPGTNLR